MSNYYERQFGALGVILIGSTVVLSGAALAAHKGVQFPKGVNASAMRLGSAALVTALSAACFSSLTVRGVPPDSFCVSFGPLRLFSKTILFADIAAVTQDRSSWLEGLGIHYSFQGRGWVWNATGRDVVRVELKNGAVYSFGTTDPKGLADYLQSKMHQ
jgi:hypothetical protein